VDSRQELETEVARARWEELGIHATIGAPVVVDGRVWGIMIAARTHEDPFPPDAEQHLADFAALVAQAIANAESRREVAALAEEQAALRRVATLVAAGRPEREVLDAVTREVGELFAADGVNLVRWEGVLDEVIVIGSWRGGKDPIPPRSPYHPGPEGVTIKVLETGVPTRGDESSPELGERCVIAAPVIVNARLWGALVAMRSPGDPFPSGAEIRLRSFSDLMAQSIANTLAQEELRASRARLVEAGDSARRKLERNLHDGAQQRLVAVSISLRLALAKLAGPGINDARPLLASAADELTHAIDELRELARGIHPAILTDRGLGPALEALAGRAPLPVEVDHALEERLPPPVEAAAYYVVSESLANVAKYAQASAVHVRVCRRNGLALVEVEDDGVGGADPAGGSGLRGLADRVEALDGRLGVDSAPAAGTRIWAEIPL
jgi:signal transduction histidine kinase